MKKTIFVMLMAVLTITACKNSGTAEKDQSAKDSTLVAAPNTLSPEDSAAGWILLFDGQTPGKWRGYNKDHFPTGWEVVDGTLHMKGSGRGEAGAQDGGDIIFPEKFQNFELNLEWKISDGGNSGIFYLAQEMADKTIWQTAPEMQVLDNLKHPDSRDTIHCAGALYDMIGVPVNKVKPVGEWNQVKILVYKGLVEHWLNGEKVVEYHLWTPEWEAMVAKSKFPQYNKDWSKVAEQGYIGLQDHGDDVWYRNIRIKKM